MGRREGRPIRRGSARAISTHPRETLAIESTLILGASFFFAEGRLLESLGRFRRGHEDTPALAPLATGDEWVLGRS
jgi:hypothetical protein